MKIFEIEKFRINIKYGFGTFNLNPDDSIKFNINPNQKLYVWFMYENIWYRTNIESIIDFKLKIDKTYCQEQLLEFLIKFV